MKTILFCLLLAAAPLQASDLWSTDYAASIAQAASQKKPVVLEFTGSDWCPPCMKQNKDVFEQPAFGEFAKDKLVLVKLDFPRSKPQAQRARSRSTRVMKLCIALRATAQHQKVITTKPLTVQIARSFRSSS
jgi:thiol-disulfide isomerase/thioredoxin